MKFKRVFSKRILAIFLVCLLIPAGSAYATEDMNSQLEKSTGINAQCTASDKVRTSSKSNIDLDEGSSIEVTDLEAFSVLLSEESELDSEAKITGGIVDVAALSYKMKTGTHDKYMSGYPGSIFKPDVGITRAEFVSVVYNLLETKPEASAGKFSDVTSNDWFAPTINALASAGIVHGQSSNIFAPNKSITRAEVVTVLKYFADGTDHSKTVLEDHFSDVSGHWAYSNIQTAYAKGWVLGDAGKFYPDRGITRAEVTTVMNRITGRTNDINYAKDRDILKMRFKDVPTTHWAFLDVTEAADPILASEAETEIGYIITTTDVNFRSEPSSDSAATIIKALPTGTILTLIDGTTYFPWYKAKTNINGEVKKGYIHSDYVKNYTTPTTSGGDGVISATTASLPQYKSLYLNTSASGIVWSSSNTDVAKVVVKDEDVSKAFIYGSAPGTATIYIKDYNGAVKSQCAVTVTDAEPVRFAYTDPITPFAGNDFNIFGITDANKTAVKFVVTGAASGSYETKEFTAESQASSSGLPDNNARVFKRTVNFAKAGDYSIKAYSKTANSDWSSSYAEFKITVSTATKTNITTRETRKASANLVDVLKSFEGSRSEVYIDTLSSEFEPTVGCGYVVTTENPTFYNNMTTSEIDAQLLQKVSEPAYTGAVNNFFAKYNVKANQYQFDALVSFAYNLGAGYFKPAEYETFQVLVNATAPPSLPATGTVNNQIGKKDPKIYAETSLSSSTYGSIPVGGTVTVSEIKRIEGNIDQLWYRVTYNGTTGWVRGGHIGFNGTSCDLAYIDEQLFGSNLLEWNMAGSTHLPGLLYRRLGEAKIFCYGNYTDAKNDGNENYKKNVGFDIPSAFQ